jgi:hypothetical protein
MAGGGSGRWAHRARDGLVGLSFLFFILFTEVGMKTASVDLVINRGIGSEAVAKTACFLPASVKICVVVLSRLLLLHFDWHLLG